MDKRNLLTVSHEIIYFFPLCNTSHANRTQKVISGVGLCNWIPHLGICLCLSLSLSVSLLLPFLLPFPSFCLLSVSGYLFQTTFSFSSLFVSISVSVSVFVSLFSPFSTRVFFLCSFSLYPPPYPSLPKFRCIVVDSCGVLGISNLVTYLLSVIHTFRSLNKKLEHDVNDKEPCHIWSYFKQWHGVRYDTCGRIKRAIRICQQDAKCIPCRVQILKEN